jgi:hypothetical protein
MLFGELALAAQVLESALKLFGEIFKHECSPGHFDCRGALEPGQMGRRELGNQTADGFQKLQGLQEMEYDYKEFSLGSSRNALEKCSEA